MCALLAIEKIRRALEINNDLSVQIQPFKIIMPGVRRMNAKADKNSWRRYVKAGRVSRGKNAKVVEMGQRDGFAIGALYGNRRRIRTGVDARNGTC